MAGRKQTQRVRLAVPELNVASVFEAIHQNRVLLVEGSRGQISVKWPNIVSHPKRVYEFYITTLTLPFPFLDPIYKEKREAKIYNIKEKKKKREKSVAGCRIELILSNNEIFARSLSLSLVFSFFLLFQFLSLSLSLSNRYKQELSAIHLPSLSSKLVIRCSLGRNFCRADTQVS